LLLARTITPARPRRSAAPANRARTAGQGKSGSSSPKNMGQTHAAWNTVHTGTQRHSRTHTHRRIHTHTHRHKPRFVCLSATLAPAGAHPLAAFSHLALSGAPSMPLSRRHRSSPAREAAKLSDALPCARAQPGVEAPAPKAVAAAAAPKATAVAAFGVPKLPSGDTAARSRTLRQPGTSCTHQTVGAQLRPANTQVLGVVCLCRPRSPPDFLPCLCTHPRSTHVSVCGCAIVGLTVVVCITPRAQVQEKLPKFLPEKLGLAAGLLARTVAKHGRTRTSIEILRRGGKPGPLQTSSRSNKGGWVGFR
jgi:hypothetical protein